MPKEIDSKAIDYIHSLLNEGKDSEFIIWNLVDNGYDYNEAVKIVTPLHNKQMEVSEAELQRGKSANLIFGIILLLIGLVVTILSTGTVIAYGAIIVGIVKIIRGLSSNNK